MSKTQLQIIFQDSDYVAINKPAGLASIPGRGESESVLSVLAAQLGLPWEGHIDPRLRVVHRLDKDTSGVLMFAKHFDAQRHVSHQFQNNQTGKEYLALVAGRPGESSGSIETQLAPHPTARQRMSVVRHGGRPARTDWRLEQQFRHYSLLRVFPKTGKTHQIRVHLKHIGLPLAMDPLYNAQPPGPAVGIFLSQFKRNYRPSADAERPLIARLTLHAEKLRFKKLDGMEVEIVAEPPKDFRATLSALARFASG